MNNNKNPYAKHLFCFGFYSGNPVEVPERMKSGNFPFSCFNILPDTLFLVFFQVMHFVCLIY